MGPLAFVFVVASRFADGFTDTATAAQPGAGVAAVFDSFGRTLFGFARVLVHRTIADGLWVVMMAMGEDQGLLPACGFPRWLAFLLLLTGKQVVFATFAIGGALSIRCIKRPTAKHGELTFQRVLLPCPLCFPFLASLSTRCWPATNTPRSNMHPCTRGYVHLNRTRTPPGRREDAPSDFKTNGDEAAREKKTIWVV